MDLFDNRGNEGLKVFEGNAPLTLSAQDCI